MTATCKKSVSGFQHHREYKRTFRKEMTPGMFSCLILLLLGIADMADCGSTTRKRNILIFGGNGFMGATTVQRLLANKDLDITIVNRGNWYWDTAETIKPYVKHIKCDRYGESSIGYKCPDIIKYIQSVDQVDAVIDFSAYESGVVVDAMKVLTQKPIKLYIYISTDSVYEVCKNKKHDGPTKETDAVRPHTDQARKKLNAADKYGNRKLECEEMLKKVHESDGPPYVILRLPDVIGPRDSTDRWLSYQLWVQLAFYTKEEVRVPAQLKDKPLSLVYSVDVARAISDLVNNEDSSLNNEAFNLAFDETVSLYDLLEMIRKELGQEDVKYQFDEDVEYYLYPSVERGPIDTNKAKEWLKWKPTPLSVAVKQTVEFYQNAMKSSHPKFIEEVTDTVQELKRDIFKDNSLFDHALNEYYDFDKHKNVRDEL